MRKRNFRAGLAAAIVCLAGSGLNAQDAPSAPAPTTPSSQSAPATTPLAASPTGADGALKSKSEASTAAATSGGSAAPSPPAGTTELVPSTTIAETARDPSLPHELSPLAMFQQADWVVKGVMIGLAFASIVSWTVWLFKTIELYTGRARLKRDLRAIKPDASLASATKTLAGLSGVLPRFIEAATLELRMSKDAPDRGGIKERVASRLERLESAAVRSMNRGLGVVASIGSTAPFVGLFGTVWGIMNSFIGISKAQTTNLAVVAPGIAEALLATAMGLAAAIPAVLIYNWFSRGLAAYRALAGDASAEVLRLVSRDLDRVDAPMRSIAAE